MVVLVEELFHGRHLNASLDHRLGVNRLIVVFESAESVDPGFLKLFYVDITIWVALAQMNLRCLQIGRNRVSTKPRELQGSSLAVSTTGNRPVLHEA